MPELPDLPLTGPRRLEVRLTSHLRFEEDAEPEVDEDVRALADLFAEPFGDVLRIRSGGIAGQFLILDARRTSSGFVEIAFFITYFGIQAVVAAPPLFQMLAPALEELAKLQWIGTGRRARRQIVDSENNLRVVERAPDQPGHPFQGANATSSPPTTFPGQPQRDEARERWGLAAAFFVGVATTILAIGGYRLAFPHKDQTASRLTAIERRLETIERAPATQPPITQTVTVLPSPTRTMAVRQSTPDRGVRHYQSGP